MDLTISLGVAIVIGILVAILILLALWAYSRANRLDRLHVRYDQSWQALDAALARRSVVARAIASARAEADPTAARSLTALADQAERASREQREQVENALSARLDKIDKATLKPALAAELGDAEARVLIARRFHNDAVRDTRTLRGRRLVRLLRLAGTAPWPTYFELSEHANLDELTAPPNRTSARVVILDEHGRALLVRGCDPAKPDVFFWFTVGGGVDAGETLREAAVREIREETELEVDADQLRGPIWRRVATFSFDSKVIRSEELYFVVRTASFEPGRGRFTDLEVRTITDFRWCDAADMRALSANGETVFPVELPELLMEANTAAALHTAPAVRAIR